MRTVFADRYARTTLFLALVLTLLLVVLTSLFIPLQQSVSMGIDASGQPLEPIASSRLLILPLLGAFALVMDVVVGLFFYRIDVQRPVSYAIWTAAVLTPFLLTIALLIIVF